MEQTTIWELGQGEISSDMSIKVHEITEKSLMSVYCPVQDFRLRKAMRDKDHIHGYRNAEVYQGKITGIMQDLLEKTLRKDTVIFFPFYFTKEAVGRDYEDKHRNEFRTFLSCIRSKERDIPRILCIKDTVNAGRDKWGKGRYGTQVVKEEDMKVKDHKRSAEAFRLWLSEHPEVTNIIFTEFATAKALFPWAGITGSMLENRYKVFEIPERPDAMVKTSDRKMYRVIFAPSGLHYMKYKDGAYNTAADIISIAMYPGKKPVMESRIVKNLEELKKVIEYIKENNNGKFSFDTETTGINPVFMGQAVISATVSIGRISWGFLVDHPRYPQYREEGLKMLRYIADLEDVTLIMQNAKFDSKWFKQIIGYFPKAKCIKDTMLQDHWLNETLGSVAGKLNMGRGYAMDTQIPRYLRIPTHKHMLDSALKNAPRRNPYKFPSGKAALAKITLADIRKIIENICSDTWMEPDSGQYSELSLHMLMRYMNLDGSYTYFINEIQEQQIAAQTGDDYPKVLSDLQHRLILSVADMELNGAPVNYDAILDKVRVCMQMASEFGDKVREATGDGFSLNSGKQLVAYLKKYEGVTSDDLVADISVYGDDDGPEGDSTEEEKDVPSVVLKELASRITWMTDYMYYRKVTKVLNTYLLPFIFHSYKGKMYYSINITGTATGRLSSDEPNIQNIPKVMKLGKKFKMGVKEVIECPEGRLFADLDLSSAEVKVLTAVCPDEKLISVLKQGLDPHSYTASFCTDATYEEIKAAHARSDEEGAVLTEREIQLCGDRSNAKRVTFGSIYRSGAAGLAKQLSIKLDTTYPNPVTGKPWKRLEKMTEIQKRGEAEATRLLDKLFNEIYPELPNTFESADTEVFNRHYSNSIFGRRRRFLGTDIPVISYLLKKAGLYSEKGKSYFTIEDCKKMIGDKKPFRQGLNHKVQSPTSDYMCYYICYIRENLPVVLKPVMHFTVHDSVLFSFDAVPEYRSIISSVCDKGMNEYLMSLSDKLPVVIGYGMNLSSRYCEIK